MGLTATRNIAVDTIESGITETDEAQARDDFSRIKTRLDELQLERTVASLYQTLPESKANDAEQTLRRIYARARRWDQ